MWVELCYCEKKIVNFGKNIIFKVVLYYKLIKFFVVFEYGIFGFFLWKLNEEM